MPMRGAVVWICLLVPCAAAALPRAGGCGACHAGSFEAWRASAHAHAIAGAAFRDCLEDYLEQAGTDAGDYCLRCHAPEALIGGSVFAETRAILQGRSRLEGVSCAVCHSVAAVVDGVAVYDAGPSRAAHQMQDLRSLGRRSLCTACHGADEPRDPARAAAPGVFSGVLARIGGIVGIRAGERTDHAFPGAAVAAAGHWACSATPGGE